MSSNKFILLTLNSNKNQIEIDVSKIPKKELDTIDAIALYLIDRRNKNGK